MDRQWGEPPIDFEGNKPASLGHCSREAYLASNWIIAIDAWDYCDASILAEMLQRHPIPFELQPVIAAIVTGKRKQNRKAAAKLKIPAGHRLIAAGLYATLKESIIDSLLDRKNIVEINGRIWGDYHTMADEKGIEIIEMRRQIQESGREVKAELADAAGISTETLENLYEDLRGKLKNYPNI